LQEKGYSIAEISNAMLKMKEENPEKEEEVPAPTPPEGMEVSELSKEKEEAEKGEKEEVPAPAPVTEEKKEAPKIEEVKAKPAKPLIEDIHALVEEVIKEKWEEVLSTIGDITTWKSKISDDLEAVKQEVLRVQSRFDNLQAAVLGKVREYEKDIKTIGSEMKALEKVFEKIMEPLTTNIKELKRIVDELKKKEKKS